MMSLHTEQELDCRGLATLTAQNVSQEVSWKGIVHARAYVTCRNQSIANLPDDIKCSYVLLKGRARSLDE